MSPNQTGNWGQRNASNDKPVPSVPTKLLATKADWEAFEERAAIMEFDGGFSRADAETLAAKLLSRYKFDRGP
jgi:phosphoheptose isomerase